MSKNLATPKVHTLFPYQEEAVSCILEHLNEIEELSQTEKDMVVLQSPTASGKTTMVLTSALHLLRAGMYDSVLILTPFRDIRDNFNVGLVSVPGDGESCQPWMVDGSKAVIRAEENVTEQISIHLEEPPCQVEGGILVATHQSFSIMDLDHDNIDWQKVLIIIDEAHRCAIQHEDFVGKEIKGDIGTKLGDSVREARIKGAQCILASATPERVQSYEQVYPKDSRIVSVSYADMIEQAGAPDKLRIDLVGPGDANAFQDLVASSMTDVEDGMGAGILSKRDARSIAKQIVKNGKKRSKDIIKLSRIKVMRENGKIVSNVETLKKALRKEWKNVRIKDATGDGGDEVLREMLQAERKAFDAEREAAKREGRKARTYEASQTDVLIVCGRGKEGTDWAVCNHIYAVGLSQSPITIAQLLGRCIRPKRVGDYSDYPEEFRNQAKLTFFVPNLISEVKDEIRTKWHSGSLLVVCFLVAQNVAREFMFGVDSRIRTRARRRGVDKKKLLKISKVLAQLIPDSSEMGKAYHNLAKIETRLKSQYDKDPTVGEVVRVVLDSDMLVPEKIAATLIGLAGGEKWKGGKTPQKIQEAIRSPLMGNKDLLNILDQFTDKLIDQPDPRKRGEKKPDPVTDTFLVEAFRELSEKYDHITSLYTKELIEVESKILGQDTRKITDDFRKLVVEVPPYYMVCRAILSFYQEGNQKLDPKKDLSGYLGYPKGSYTIRRLERDLKLRRISGQPDDVANIHDLSREFGNF